MFITPPTLRAAAHAWLLAALPAAAPVGGIAMAQESAFTPEFVQQQRKLAEQGDAAAQYHLGVAYHSGWGAPQDKAQAVKWWQRACACA